MLVKSDVTYQMYFKEHTLTLGVWVYEIVGSEEASLYQGLEQMEERNGLPERKRR